MSAPVDFLSVASRFGIEVSAVTVAVQNAADDDVFEVRVSIEGVAAFLLNGCVEKQNFDRSLAANTAAFAAWL